MAKQPHNHNFMAVTMQSWEAYLKHFPQQWRQLPCLEATMGYAFSNRSRLIEALSHRSAVAEFSALFPHYSPLPWNERLEYLGDAVLGLVIGTYLWKDQACLSEGDLSRLRSTLVNERNLHALALRLNLEQAIFLGKGEERSQGRQRSALLADTLEALIAAVYVDGGFAAAEAFIHRLFSKDFQELPFKKSEDHKSQLQEWAQEMYQQPPIYEVLQERGPAHCKEFKVGVHVHNHQSLGSGWGKTKKEASQAAAQTALASLKRESEIEKDTSP